MPDPRDLLICLLDYIKEQAKQIHPAAYRLANAKSFQRQRGEIAGLPGVEFDIKVAGDHVWLRIPRLIAEPPPSPQSAHKALLRFSLDPSGLPPSIDDAALARQINQRIQSAKLRNESADPAQVEVQAKAAAAEALSAYSSAWTRWATGERPRRQTIALYGDFFTLMHQMEAEQTSKPQELVWGIGISSWQLKTEKESVPFEYPLLTQTMELSIDDRSMSIEIRPRATDILGSNCFDAFVLSFYYPPIWIVEPCSDLPCVIYCSKSSKDIPYQRQRLIGRVELVAWKVLLSAECNAEDSAAPLPVICG